MRNVRQSWLFVFVLAFGNSAFAQRQLTFDDVKQLATDAVSQRQFQYDVPQIVYDSHAKTIWWAWGNFLLPVERPIDYVVRAQARVEVFRVGYSGEDGSGGYGDAWESMAAQSEELIKNEMLTIAYDPQLSDKDKIELFKRVAQKDRDRYEAALRDWANNHGWIYQPGRGSSDAFRVRLVTNPRGGTIFLAHVVRWGAARAEGKDPRTVMRRYADGSNFIWTGEHMIGATFPNGETLAIDKKLIQSHGIVHISSTGIFVE